MNGFPNDFPTGTVHDLKQHPNQLTGNKLHVVTCRVSYEINEDYLTWEEHMHRAPQQGSSLASIQDRYAYGRIQTLPALSGDQPYWLGGEVVNGQWVWSDGTPWNSDTYVVSGGTTSGNVLTLENTYGGSLLRGTTAATSLPAIYQRVNFIQVAVNDEGSLYFGPPEVPSNHTLYDGVDFNGGYQITPDGKQIGLWGNKLVQFELSSLMDEENLFQSKIGFDFVLHNSTADVFFESNGL
eukprot:8473470-Ditylum_brightwellii.AAC.1